MKTTKCIANRTYPYVGISNLGIIVLFTAYKTGVVIYQEKYKIGGDKEIGTYFPGTICEDDFQLFDGVVTISN